MKQIKYSISLNDKSYKSISVITNDDFKMIKKHNPHMVFTNLLMKGDAHNISLDLFDITDVDDDIEAYMDDPKGILKRLLKQSIINEENEYIYHPEVPSESGYYNTSIYNIMNKFNTRIERLYYSQEKGWMASETEDLMNSWLIKYWQY